MDTANPPLADLERDLRQAFAVVPSVAVRRRIDDRVGRAITLAPSRQRRLNWLTASFIAGALLLIGAGYYVVTQSPVPSVLNPGQPLACSGLVGGTPEAAATDLTDRGYRIVWILETSNAADDRFGSAERVDAMPTGVVLDIVVRGTEAEVRIAPLDDPLATTAAARAEAERSSCP